LIPGSLVTFPDLTDLNLAFFREKYDGRLAVFCISSHLFVIFTLKQLP